MFQGWSVLLLNRRDEGRFLFFCYARCTLVGRSETELSQGRFSRRDATSLKQPEILGQKSSGF